MFTCFSQRCCWFKHQVLLGENDLIPGQFDHVHILKQEKSGSLYHWPIIKKIREDTSSRIEGNSTSVIIKFKVNIWRALLNTGVVLILRLKLYHK